MTSASERARRNADMAARKAAGATWTEVAAEFGVAKSTARKGVADHIAAGGAVVLADPLGVRPQDALRDALDTYSWALAGLRGLAAEGDNSSARVGAIRAAVGVVEKRLELLIAAGVLPTVNVLLRERLNHEKREFAAAVVTAVERVGAEWKPVQAELDLLLPPRASEAVAA